MDIDENAPGNVSQKVRAGVQITRRVLAQKSKTLQPQ